MAVKQAPAAAAERTEEPAASLGEGVLEGFPGPKLRVLWNLLNARMVEALAPFGLRSGAFSTLATISANPGCSLTELAGSLGMDKSAMVAILDELEVRGLVNRMRSAQDRRRHALSLTPEGEALKQRMFPEVQKPGLPIRQAFTRAEMSQFLSLLDRAYQAMAEAPPMEPMKRV